MVCYLTVTDVEPLPSLSNAGGAGLSYDLRYPVKRGRGFCGLEAFLFFALLSPLFEDVVQCGDRAHASEDRGNCLDNRHGEP